MFSVSGPHSGNTAQCCCPLPESLTNAAGGKPSPAQGGASGADGLPSTSVLVSYLINFVSSFIRSHPSFQRRPSDGTREAAEEGGGAGDGLMQGSHECPRKSHGDLPPLEPRCGSCSQDELIAGVAALSRLELQSPSHREIATFHAVNHQSGRRVLTHLAVMPKQVTATAAGPRARALGSVISKWVALQLKVTNPA